MSIWQSWSPYINSTEGFQNNTIGRAVQFLEMTNREVFEMHFDITFGDHPLASLITLIIVFCLAFFLSTYMPVEDNKRMTPNPNKSELCKILIFQFFVQIPLFTILSCDFGRTIPLSIYTTFFLFHFSYQNEVKIFATKFIANISNRMMHFSDSHALIGNPWLYYATVILFPFQTFVPSLVYDNIIVHTFEKISKYLL